MLTIGILGMGHEMCCRDPLDPRLDISLKINMTFLMRGGRLLWRYASLYIGGGVGEGCGWMDHKTLKEG